jgi:hypothetical protein
VVGDGGLADGPEEAETERQQRGALAIGQKAEMPNANEALWQGVQQKAAQELVNR